MAALVILYLVLVVRAVCLIWALLMAYTSPMVMPAIFVLVKAITWPIVFTLPSQKLAWNTPQQEVGT
jgi:hypothetical protein